MGLNENSKRYDGLERPSETCFEVSDGLFSMWVYLGAAKMPVWFSRNKTVKPVK